ncbi:hypothetical protein P2318_09415 [Myxococcaceae bacterium GXIMD 01537]
MNPAPSADLSPPPAGIRQLDALLVALVATSMGLVLATVDSDPDLWGRIAYARLALEQGRLFPSADPYSYTVPGGQWQDHEYGFSWLAWGVHSALGWPGLRLLRLGLYFTALGLCLGPAWRLARGSGPRLLLFALPALAMAPGFVGPRAQSVTFVLFAWLLFCLQRAPERGAGWVLAGVAPMPLWVNFHGGFLAGGGVACVWGAVMCVRYVRSRDWKALGLLAAGGAWCLGSLFVTPWGPEYPLFLLRTATMPRPYVPEWAAPALFSGNWWLVVALAVVGAVALWARPRRWQELAALAVVVLAASRHQRHIPFLAVGVLLFAVPAVLAAYAARRPGALEAPPRKAVLTLGAVLGAGVLALLGGTVSAVFKGTPAEPNFPARAMDEIERQGLKGGLLVDFEWAQYVIYRLPPGVQVAFDGRYEAVYPDAVVDAFVAWNYGHEGWEALPSDPRTKLALVGSSSDRASRLLASPGWKRVYEDEVASLFTKTDAPAEQAAPTP